MSEALYVTYAHEARAIHRESVRLLRAGEKELAALKRKVARDHMDWAWQAKDTLPIHVSLRRAA